MNEQEIMNVISEVLAGPEGEDILLGIGALASVVMVFAVIAAIGALIYVICRWRIFTKAGEKGWKALIPYYATYTEYSITWIGILGIVMQLLFPMSGYLTTNYEVASLMYIIGSILGLAAAVIGFMQVHKLSRAFGHGFGFTLGLLFLNPIFMLILAFGKSEYVGPAVKSN